MDITAWVSGLISALKLAVSAFVARVFAALGLSWVSFEYVLPNLKQWLIDRAAVLPPDAVAFLSAIGLDIFMVMIISAYVARIGLQVFLVSTAKLEAMISAAGG